VTVPRETHAQHSKLKLLLSSGGFGGGVGVLLGEAFDASSGIHELLLAGEERVAIGANFDAQHVALDGGASGESVPTGTVDGNGVIVGVNTGFHESPFCRGRSAPHPGLAGATAASLGRKQLPIITRESEFRQLRRLVR